MHILKELIGCLSIFTLAIIIIILKEWFMSIKIIRGIIYIVLSIVVYALSYGAEMLANDKVATHPIIYLWAFLKVKYWAPLLLFLYGLSSIRQGIKQFLLIRKNKKEIKID